MSSQKVLLTGGNGYIGVETIKQLLEAGFDVTTSVRSESKTTFLRNKFASFGDRLSYAIVPDIVVEGAFDEALKKGNFDYVLHTSSPFVLEVEDVDRDLLIPAIQGTVGIFKSVQKYAPTVKRITIISSFASIVDLSTGDRPGYIYSEKDWNPVTREEALKDGHIGYYGSKTFAERAAWDFLEQNKPSFSFTALCPPMVYGPPEQEITSLDKLNTSVAGQYAIFNGKAGAETGIWVWVDVRDISRALVASILKDKEYGNERFLISAGNYTNVDTVSFIWKNYPERAKEKGVAKPPAERYPPTGVYSVDNSKGKKVLGLEYISHEKMLDDTYRALVDLEKKFNA